MNDTPRAAAMRDSEWWRSALIYQIYPRSFYSAHGKGTGDLHGIAMKSEYLARLGIDMVWISPFFSSPMKDYGYDISDYRDVDPLFGSLEDFDRLIDTFHARGIRVMIDQVYNHTSDQHPWFLNSRTDKNAPKADWYLWRDPTATGNPPNNWLSVFSKPAWSWHSGRRQYFLHQFLPEQPDLDFNNPEVQRAILEVAEFWFKRRVDGFRLDTVSHYVQDPRCPDNPPFPVRAGQEIPINPYEMQREKYNQGQPGNLLFLKKLRALAEKYNNKILLGELGSYNEDELQGIYTRDGDALHIAYTFTLLRPAITPRQIAHAYSAIAPHLGEGWPSWAFSNHDVVRAINRHESLDPRAHDAYAKLLLTVLLALRGTPCIYQGEELALSNQDLTYAELRDPFGKNLWPKWRGRDGCRTPIPWQRDAPHGGFSSATPWLPMKENHRIRAVDQQERDPHSTLNFYRQFIRWRKGQATLCGTGALSITEANDDMLIFTREGSPSICCAYNFSPHTQRIKQEGTLLRYPQCAAAQSGEIITLPEYSSAFVEIKGYA